MIIIFIFTVAILMFVIIRNRHFRYLILKESSTKDKVLLIITKKPSIDDEQIAKILGITMWQVCKITHELKQENLIVVEPWLGSDI